MSLRIATDLVKAVLLADGWHEVANNSFDIDAYEFVDGASDDAAIVHGGGQSGVCASGFTFDQGSGQRISGPLTAVLAVRHER